MSLDNWQLQPCNLQVMNNKTEIYLNSMQNKYKTSMNYDRSCLSCNIFILTEMCSSRHYGSIETSHR